MKGQGKKKGRAGLDNLRSGLNLNGWIGQKPERGGEKIPPAKSLWSRQLGQEKYLGFRNDRNTLTLSETFKTT